MTIRSPMQVQDDEKDKDEELEALL